ncbi:nuclear transport factor 2 family protein [Arthrobacter sp. NPDC090010]|uniref:nuclear transport factor 2 family protein n=1 Tax=Arthrobacter sp. NPDC090010 TaxID=3363942 RepID=UPI00380F458C
MSENAALPAPVDAFVEAVNRHDEEAFLDFFPTDGFVDDWGRVFTGRKAIKSWSDKEFIGARGVMTVQNVTQDAGSVTVVADWRSEYANGLSSFTFAVSGGKLASMTIREG